MRKQQQIWHNEHTSDAGAIPKITTTAPASGVVKFTDYLQKHSVSFSGKAVDIGAGKGRNSVLLAKLGFAVWAMEYIEPAVAAAKQLAEKEGVADGIHFELAEIDTAWKFADNFFDVAVDSFASIDIETKTGREVCRDELFRTLKPGGYALVTVCSADDEWEKELIAKHPGPEPNSTVWPQNGKFQKDYTESELREFYKPFEIIELQKISKPTFKLGREGTAVNFWVVLRKPAN